MFCEVSRYVKSSLAVVIINSVVVSESKSSFVFRVLPFWNLLFAVSITEFVALYSPSVKDIYRYKGTCVFLC